MINGSVYENKVSRLKTRIIDIQSQIIVYLTRGEPDNHVKRMQLDIKGVEAEIRKVQGEDVKTEASKVGLG